jgi:serine/threonine protein kinase
MFNRVIDLVDDIRGCISKVKYGQWCEQLDVMYDDLIGIACAEADKAAHFHKEQVHKHGADTEFMYVDVNTTASEGSSPSVLGKGRYGTLYKKLSKSDGCIYALKVIEISDPEWLARGRKECALLEKLKHVHIVRCFSGFPSSDNQRFLLVMELIEGGTLESVIGTRPSEAQIAQWIWQAASGLSYMHEKGVCHRDIKPSNLMLTATQKIKIIDLGVASDAGAEGRKTAGVGTSNYSSYEKSVGLPYDGKDDVWGLGCVLIELLTDRR